MNGDGGEDDVEAGKGATDADHTSCPSTGEKVEKDTFHITAPDASSSSMESPEVSKLYPASIRVKALTSVMSWSKGKVTYTQGDISPFALCQKHAYDSGQAKLPSLT